jgi:hypothetical protein
VDQMQTAVCQACARTETMPPARANLGMPDGPKALGILQKLVAAGKKAAGAQTAAG